MGHVTISCLVNFSKKVTECPSYFLTRSHFSGIALMALRPSHGASRIKPVPIASLLICTARVLLDCLDRFEFIVNSTILL